MRDAQPSKKRRDAGGAVHGEGSHAASVHHPVPSHNDVLPDLFGLAEAESQVLFGVRRAREGAVH